MASSSTRQYSTAPKPKAEPTVQRVEHVHTHVRSSTPRKSPFVSRRTSRAVSNVSVGGSDAQGIIVTSALVTFSLAFLNSYLVPRKTPRIRLFIGVGILYIGLSIVAQFNDRLARGFAILVMLTALITEGGGVLNWLMGRGTHDKLNIFGGGTGTPNIPAIGVATGPSSGPSFTPSRPIGKYQLPPGPSVPIIPRIP